MGIELSNPPSRGGAKLIYMKLVLHARLAGIAGNANKTLYFLFQQPSTTFKSPALPQLQAFNLGFDGLAGDVAMFAKKGMQ
jgi:hypothetical protein